MSKKMKVNLFALIVCLFVNGLAQFVNYLAGEGIDSLKEKKLEKLGDDITPEEEKHIARTSSIILIASSVFCSLGMIFIPIGLAKNYADKIGYIPE